MDYKEWDEDLLSQLKSHSSKSISDIEKLLPKTREEIFSKLKEIGSITEGEIECPLFILGVVGRQMEILQNKHRFKTFDELYQYWHIHVRSEVLIRKNISKHADLLRAKISFRQKEPQKKVSHVKKLPPITLKECYVKEFTNFVDKIIDPPTLDNALSFFDEFYEIYDLNRSLKLFLSRRYFEEKEKIFHLAIIIVSLFILIRRRLSISYILEELKVDKKSIMFFYKKTKESLYREENEE